MLDTITRFLRKIKSRSGTGFRRAARARMFPAYIAASIAVTLTAFFPSPARSAQVMNVAEQNNKLFIAGGGVTVRYDLFTGKFDIFRSNSELIIEQGFSTAEISGKTEAGAAATQTLAMDGKDKLNWFMEQVSGPLGSGTKITVLRRLPDAGIVLKNYISFFDNQPGIMLQSGVKNISGSPVYVSRLTPTQAQSPDGGLFIGLDPANSKSLATYFFCRDDPSLLLQGGGGKNTTCSDGAGAFYDALSDRGLAAGFITQNSAVSTISSMYDPARAAREPGSERLGFTFFRASCGYSPAPALPAGQAMDSETLALLPSWGPPSQELETYGKYTGASNSAKNLRPPAILTYGDCCAPEKTMSSAAAFSALDDAINRLGPPAATIFKLGPGWSKSIGDWSPGAGFPDGMKAAAAGVHKRNLKAGITITPFAVERESRIAKERPDWLLSGYESVRPPSGPALLRLDASKPGVQNMVFTLARRASREWGFDYIEIDMTGFTTPPKMFFNRNATAQEATLKYIKLIRDAAGPAAIIGVVNAEPTDILPGVDVASVAFTAGDAPDKTNPPLERTYSFLNMTRLYFFNGRARSNNPGPIPTETPAKSGYAPPDDPSIWLTAAAFYGGALEARIGAAAPDEKTFARLRRLLPLYPRGAAPVDIFEKGLGNGFFAQSPSRKLNLKVNADWGKWNVIGLFNNSPVRDKDTGRPAAPDTPANFTIKFSDLGLSPVTAYHIYDFWDETYLGEATGQFTAQAPPMGMKVIGAREALPRPQLLSSNRHYTMGGVEIPSLSWDDSADTLSGTLIATAGFPHKLAFHIPDGYEFASATVEGNPGAVAEPAPDRPDALYLSFTPSATGEVKWSLTFTKTETQ